jgi:hypothetical protein
MSFLRHKQIYQSDAVQTPERGRIRLRPGSLRFDESAASYSLAGWSPPVESPPPLYQPVSIFGPPAEAVNHHPAGAGEFSTGEMRNFHPALTKISNS